MSRHGGIDEPQEVRLQAEVTSAPISQDLVVAYVSGDREAFQTIFERLKRDVYFQVRRFFRSPFDQEEAFQEVWLQLYRVRHRFDVDRHTEFSAWTRQVGRNRCLDLLKARGRRPEIPVEQTGASCDPPQHQQLVQQRLRQVVGEVVAKLEPPLRDFFELCFVKELTHEAIAVELAITVRRSKYLKKKLLARLVRSTALRKVRSQCSMHNA